MHYLGLEIGGTKLQLVLGTAEGIIRERRRLNVDSAQGAEGIRRQIIAALPELLPGAPRRIGVGFGGPVDWRTGRIARSHQIDGWSEFPLAEWLQEQTGLPAVVENDANTAALAEARLGAGRGASSLFYVTLGSGVGGGLVSQDGLYHGQPPGEAEFGHLRLDRQGTTIEQCCSGWALDRRVRDLIQTDPGSLLARLAATQPGAEARHLETACAAGDPAALRILQVLAEDLAYGLSHVVHLCHPEVIVLGGGVALLGQPLVKLVAEALPRFVMEVFRPGPRLLAAELREDAVPAGALLLAGAAEKIP